MPKETKTFCDNCNTHIENNQYRIDQDFQIPFRLSTIFVNDLFSRDYYFCGLGCLAEWIEKDKMEWEIDNE